MITLEEMRDGLVEEGMSEEEACKIFESVNQDRTSYVSYTEFLAATMSKRLYLTQNRLNSAFDALDVDASGFITRNNLRELLGDDFSKERVDAIIRDADIRNDGHISREEFMHVMASQGEQMIEAVHAVATEAGKNHHPSPDGDDDEQKTSPPPIAAIAEGDGEDESDDNAATAAADD